MAAPMTRRRPRASSPDLALPEHHVLERGEAFDAHRAPGMELVRADADFGTHPELEAVREAGARIDHHAGRVSLAQETLGVHVVARDDGVGVVARIAVDVG